MRRNKVVLHIAVVALHDQTPPAGLRSCLVLGCAFLYLSKTQLENFCDIDIILGARFYPGSLIRLCKFFALRGFDLSISLKVHFRADNNTRNIRYTAKIDNLIVHNLDHVKGISARDGVHKDIAMNSDRVISTQEGELILACCIEDFALVFSAFVVDSLDEGTLYSRVIRFDKMIFDKLNDQ